MRVRMGIVGAGAVVRQHHLPALRALPHLFEVTAICGKTATRAAALAARAGARLCGSAAEVSGSPDVDAVLAAVPIDQTFRVAMGALESGKHVLVEKPIGASLAEADALVRRAYELPAVAMIAQQSCYWGWVQALSQQLRAGAIGRVVWIDVQSIRSLKAELVAAWRAAPGYPGGYFWDGGVHWTSIIRMFAGELELGSAVLGEVVEALGGPESVVCHFRTNAGVSGALTYRRSVGDPPRADATIQLVGTEGSISATPGEIVLNRLGRPIERQRVAPDAPFVTQLEHFHACIEGAENVNPLAEGEADLRTAARILRWAGFEDQRVLEVEGKAALAETSKGRRTAPIGGAARDSR